jgi:uncharacterized protein involved in exopolysaccharide biosynthesis
MSGSRVTLSELVHIASRYWASLVAVILVVTALAIGFSFVLPDTYRAQAVLVIDDGERNASSQFAQLGGLAALAGLTLPGTNDRSAVAIATLRSGAIARTFIESQNLMPVLFPSAWDAERSDWKSTDPESRPTMWDAERKLRQQIVNIEDDRLSGLVELSVQWTDPTVLEDWVATYVRLTNEKLKQDALTKANENLAYLRARLEKETTLEVRQAVSDLIGRELNTLMLAESAREFAFSIVDPAYVPTRPTSPNRVVLGIVGFIAGLVFAAAALLTLAVFRAREVA